MIEEIRKLIEIPSITGKPLETDLDAGEMPYGREVYRALTTALDICREYGFQTKNCNNRCGWAQIGQGSELIGILAHLDVVPPGEGWDSDPFVPAIKNGKLYGRGVLDDKGPAMAAVEAMKNILDSGVQLKKRIRIIFGCQEEEGDWLDIDYYKDTEEIPDYGFTPDADFPAIYGEKGILITRIDFPRKGSNIKFIEGGTAENVVPNRARLILEDGQEFFGKGIQSHGSTPMEGKNAISDLLSQVTELSDFAKFYMNKIGFNYYGENIGCDFEDKESGKLTFSVGVISSDEENIHLDVDMRCPVTFGPETILEGIGKALDGTGAKFSVTSWMPPVYMDKKGKVITTLIDAYERITGDSTEPMVMGGGTYARAMDNIVAFGPVFPGHPCTEHMANEYAILEDLEKAKTIYYEALKGLLEI